MARRKGLENRFEPTKGVVTEFTDTRFPTDAAIDADNVIFDKDGSVRRRPGVNLEVDWVLRQVGGTDLTDTARAEWAWEVGLWKAVANSGTLDIVVVQAGIYLQFYAQIGSVSANFLGEVDLTEHAVDAVEAAKSSLSFAGGIGNLYVVGQYVELLQVSYDGTDFTVTPITLEERDFIGLDEDLAIDERPSQLTLTHYYNLRNQGWTDENLLIFADREDLTNICATITPSSPINAGGGLDWPSNADIMHLGFTTDPDTGDPIFSREAITDEHYLGNTPAPKGHFILNPFLRDRSEALECDGIPAIVSPVRSEALTFHNGRVFFASARVQNQPNGIFYSRQLIREEYVAEVRPEADPTSDQINELVATDGGFIPTPAIGQIVFLEELGNGVLVGATNGVWYLSGASVDEGFTATGNRLAQIDEGGVLGNKSFVKAEGVGFYWGVNGVMTVSIGDLGSPVVRNVSENTIQSLYVGISAESRREAKGVYIPEQRKVFWGYSDASFNESVGKAPLDRMLVFDLNIGGFYPYSIQTDSLNNFPEVFGLSFVKPIGKGTGDEIVVENDGTVVTENDDVTLVTIADTGNVSQVTQAKMLTHVFEDGGWKITFAEFNDRTFHDWRIAGEVGTGLDYSSFVEFGYHTGQTNHTRLKPTYVHSFFSKRSKSLTPGGYYELPPTIVVPPVQRICAEFSALSFLQFGSLATPTVGNHAGSFYMSPDGTFIITYNQIGRRLFRADFGTPYDASTLTPTSFSVIMDPAMGEIAGAWLDNGTVYYVSDADTLTTWDYQYWSAAAFDPTSLSAAPGSDIASDGSNFPGYIVADYPDKPGHAFGVDLGTDIEIDVPNGDVAKLYTLREYTFSDLLPPAPFGTNELTFVTDGAVVLHPINIAFLDGGLLLHIHLDRSIVGEEDSILQFELDTPYDLTTAKHTEEFVTIFPERATPYLFADGNGTPHMYGVGTTGTVLNQYDYVCGTREIYVAANTTGNFMVDNCDAVHYSNNGDKILHVDNVADELRVYTLSTPWDISTASLTHTLSYTDLGIKAGTVVTGVVAAHGNISGTGLGVATEDNEVLSFSMIGWNISTMTLIDNFSRSGVKDFDYDDGNFHFSSPDGRPLTFNNAGVQLAGESTFRMGDQLYPGESLITEHFIGLLGATGHWFAVAPNGACMPFLFSKNYPRLDYAMKEFTPKGQPSFIIQGGGIITSIGCSSGGLDGLALVVRNRIVEEIQFVEGA